MREDEGKDNMTIASDHPKQCDVDWVFWFTSLSVYHVETEQANGSSVGSDPGRNFFHLRKTKAY